MIDYYVPRKIRDQFSEAFRSICPDARPVEYAHESDMGGANPSVDALHRYFDSLGDIAPAAFIVDRETDSAHDPFDADQARVRAWTSHIRDLMEVCEVRMMGVPAAASLMCMLPANASWSSPMRFREAVRRQAALGMWDFGSAHHVQIFADDRNTAGLWMTDEFDRCRARIDLGVLPPWPIWCQWCPATKGTQTTPGLLHATGVLAKNLEHNLKYPRIRPQLWWPLDDMAHPAIAYMLREVGDLMGRRGRVPVGGGVE